MAATAGTDPSLQRVPMSAFTPGNPMANDTGLRLLCGPCDLAVAV